MGAWLAGNVKQFLDCFELTDNHLLGISRHNASSSYSMTCKLQSFLEASGIASAALIHHQPCIAHAIWLALVAFMSSLGVDGRTKSREAHERDQQFGENESTVIRKSQRLQKAGNASTTLVSAMRPG
jgi:hypothetical protein